MSNSDLIIVLGILAMALPLGGLSVVVQRRRTTNNSVYNRFKALFASVGLTPLQHPMSLMQTFFVGEWEGIRVMGGFDTGRRLSTVDQKGGTVLYMETGALPLGTWSVFLRNGEVQSSSGKGDGKETVLGLIDAPVRSLAKAFPALNLSAAHNLLKGSPVELAISTRWSEGWKGLYLHAGIPFNVTEGDLRLALERLRELRAALRAASGARE